MGHGAGTGYRVTGQVLTGLGHRVDGPGSGTLGLHMDFPTCTCLYPHMHVQTDTVHVCTAHHMYKDVLTCAHVLRPRHWSAVSDSLSPVHSGLLYLSVAPHRSAMGHGIHPAPG